MLAAVLSDTHDHIMNVRGVLALARERGAALLIHCGDIVAPFMLRELAAFPGPVHLVFGNNDGDPLLLSRTAAALPNVTLHGLLGVVDVDGARVAFTHTGELARPLAASGQFDAVFFGHSHAAETQWVGRCLLLNPGDVMGKDARPSFALYDSQDGTAETLVLDQAVGP
jgi:putative phosphoesterase